MKPLVYLGLFRQMEKSETNSFGREPYPNASLSTVQVLR